MPADSDQSIFLYGLYNAIEANCTDQQLERFARLSSDIERVRFVRELSGPNCFGDLQLDANGGKSADEALRQKNLGNAAFQSAQFDEACRLYGLSMRSMPAQLNDGADLAILLSNRSAALYRMQQYDLALSDIDEALPQYPKHLLYKLFERKAQCMLAKNEFAKALECFQKTISALDDADVPLVRRQKLDKDAHIMLKLLQPKIDALRKAKLEPAKVQASRPVRDFTSSNLSAAVGFDRNESEGCFAQARQPIEIGEQILAEKPFCAVLLDKFARTHCAHCFRRAIVPVHCAGCADVTFCSRDCRAQAAATYHGVECRLLRVLWNSGTSVTVHMALRAVAQQPVRYFRGLRDELADGRAMDVLRLPVADYRRVYNLVRHETSRSPRNFLKYATMAYFLTHCLQLAGYFADAGQADVDLVGGLILRNLQVMQFNSHELYELRKDGTRTVFLGGGLYPTLALFNHSCKPSIVRYYKGTAVYVHAIEPIASGERINENYGPLFSQDPIDGRRSRLKEQYWFDCRCEPCTERWPTFDEMRSDEIRFRCDNRAECDNVIVVPVATDAFMFKCDRCGKFTNILKGLKALQETDQLGQAAKRHERAGEWRACALSYIKMLNLMREYLAQPIADYCKAQQSLKDCLLRYGNKE